MCSKHSAIFPLFCNWLKQIEWLTLNQEDSCFPFYRLILLVGLGYLLAIHAMPAEDGEEGEEEEEEEVEEGECGEPGDSGGDWCWSLTDLLIQR